MSDINKAYIDALLADATYVDVTPSMNADALTEALQERMTPQLAAMWAARGGGMRSRRAPLSASALIERGTSP